MPSDPRWSRYDELQRTLAAAVNWRAHPDMVRLVRTLDPMMWRAVHQPALVRAVKAEMRLMLRGGCDD